MVRLRLWPQNIKTEARKLRKAGFSYGKITGKLKVPKSTLHSWIHDIKRPIYITNREKRKHLEKIRPLATLAIKKERKERLDRIMVNVNKELKKYPINNKNYLKSILSMLYWAEGAKGRGSLAFANTDPKLTLLYLTLLRKCYNINENKLRVRLHLHYYHKIKEQRLFWSKLLNIPEKQFGKIHVKKRSISKRFKRNFAGICLLRYHSENLRFEVLKTSHILADKILKKAPVA